MSALSYAIGYGAIGAVCGAFSSKKNLVPLAVGAAAVVFLSLSWPKYILLSVVEYAIGAGIVMAVKNRTDEA